MEYEAAFGYKTLFGQGKTVLAALSRGLARSIGGVLSDLKMLQSIVDSRSNEEIKEEIAKIVVRVASIKSPASEEKAVVNFLNKLSGKMDTDFFDQYHASYFSDTTQMTEDERLSEKIDALSSNLEVWLGTQSELLKKQLNASEQLLHGQAISVESSKVLVNSIDEKLKAVLAEQENLLKDYNLDLIRALEKIGVSIKGEVAARVGDTRAVAPALSSAVAPTSASSSSAVVHSEPTSSSQQRQFKLDPKLKTFSGGAKELVDDWLFDVKNSFITANVPQELKLNCVATHLSGAAHHLLKEHINKGATWEQFKTELRKRYEPVDEREQLI